MLTGERKAKVRVLVSNTHNPWFNLATEEWIFNDLDPNTQTLFLWRNQETVVIGRSQNPWSECNLAKMEQDGVLLARRTSGGGAVFHDLGNTCFTFLSPREGYDRSVNNEILLNALKRFGIEAQASGRNDIVVMADDGPRKVSGSAFRETRDRAFHHGTFLIRTDLTRLANYLTPHPKKIESKGRASVRARVMNLSEIAEDLVHDVLAKALIEEFFERHGAECEIETLDPNYLQGLPALQTSFEKFASWEWRFGQAPKFHYQMAEYFGWGFVEVYIDADKGRIQKAQVYSDVLFPDLIEAFQAALGGKSFSGGGIKEAASETLQQLPQHEAEIKDLERWLAAQTEIA